MVWFKLNAPSLLLLLALRTNQVLAEVFDQVHVGLDGQILAATSSANARGTPAAALEEAPNDSPFCDDLDEDCDNFMRQGECSKNPSYMHQYCPKACGLCGKQDNQAGITAATTKQETIREVRVTGEYPEQPEPQRRTTPEIIKRDDDFDDDEDPFGLDEGDEKPQTIQQDDTQSANKEDDSVQPKLDEETFPDCQDLHEDCALWKTMGECDAIDGNPEYMIPNCPRSCKLCGKGEIDAILEKAMRLRNEDLSVSGWGEDQKVPRKHHNEMTALLDDVNRYMLQEVNIDGKYQKIKKKCLNRHAECAFWAFKGHCDSNPAFMQYQCAPICRTCHMLDFNYRCPMPENIPEIDAWKPGDLDKMFERIITDITNVNIHSRPSAVEAHDGPWVLTIDKFLTDEECDRLIELGHAQGYQRSVDVGKVNLDGSFEDNVNDGRTSSNAWCLDNCHNDAKTQSVLQKIVNLTGIADHSSEYLQLLKYETGQFYNTHHDYIELLRDRPQGVRILTVFLYLNEPEAGGGTNFPDLAGGITIMPKKGTVLLWPSVLNDDPNSKDDRTMHQALPVEKGLKFGANAWVHQRDFKTPYSINCD